MNGARCRKSDNIIHTAGHSDKAGVTNASVPTCGCAKRGLFVELEVYLADQNGVRVPQNGFKP
jgi:hypothetical protein